ncbi:MAG: hypothetical protein IPL27_19225 [Lewinellaceae bacterium]|nr:hypothetical protein [Lewinellaceae bacterium]
MPVPVLPALTVNARTVDTFIRLWRRSPAGRYQAYQQGQGGNKPNTAG